MTWVAFDRAVKSVEKFGFEAPLEAWRVLRDTIHRDVCANGFDAELNAFVESYGSKMFDASILLLPSVGFLPPEDPRVRGTLAAVERHMMRDGFVLRHDPREVEQQPAEGAFPRREGAVVVHRCIGRQKGAPAQAPRRGRWAADLSAPAPAGRRRRAPSRRSPPRRDPATVS